MTATIDPRALHADALPAPPTGSYRTYAIVFDLDADGLQHRYPTAAWRNAYRDVRDTLAVFGFTWQQGSVQYGNAEVTPVTCVLAVQELIRRYDWFAPCVRDIRMLRIVENDDLMPVVTAV